MAQYKVKLKKVNAIVGVDIEIKGNDAGTMAIAYRDHNGDTHTLEIDGSMSVYSEFKEKVVREYDRACSHLYNR